MEEGRDRGEGAHQARGVAQDVDDEEERDEGEWRGAREADHGDHIRQHPDAQPQGGGAEELLGLEELAGEGWGKVELDREDVGRDWEQRAEREEDLSEDGVG